MQKKHTKNTKSIALLTLLSVICTGGIVFAAYSATLSIKGSANYSQTQPLVRFKDGSVSISAATGNTTGSATGGASFTNTLGTDLSITSNNLTIESYSVNFTEPGTATLGFTVENVGSATASLTTVTIGTPTCTPSGSANTAFADALCAKISVSLTGFTSTDTLTAAAEKNGTLVVALSEVPTVGTPGPVSVAISDTTMTYTELQP